MKSKIITLAVAFVFVLLAFGMYAQAAQLVPLDSREAALVGATHVARFTFEDFASSTSTNTALVITNLSPITAKEQVECVAMVLETAFDTGNTNYTGSVLMKVGDSSDDDLFLTSTELASDGSEVFVKAGRNDAPTSTLTLQRISLTDTNGVTASVCTNATAAIVAGVVGKKIYTADNYLKFTFTPNTEEALSANTKGAVLVYFRKLK